MTMRFFPLLLFICAQPLVADTHGAALEAMRNGARFMRSISAGGGYLWRYSTDMKLVAGEVKASKAMIWIQPPGTHTVGGAFLEAHEATGDEFLLDCALAVGDALAQSQLESGGWDYRFDFASPQRWYRQVDRGNLNAKDIAKRRNITTFDDDNSQSALHFLMALADHCRQPLDERKRRILHARTYGLTKLL